MGGEKKGTNACEKKKAVSSGGKNTEGNPG